jgi:hypothetical protein
MIALLKYGSGLPFNRLEGLQGSLGIPLPSSTQWDIVSGTAKVIEPVYEQLILQATWGRDARRLALYAFLPRFLGAVMLLPEGLSMASGATVGLAT